MRLVRKLFLILVAMVFLFSIVSCNPDASVFAKKRDYSNLVYDTSNDAGKLTARYIGLKEYYEDMYPRDCVIYTSPEGLVMMVDCGNQVSYLELEPVLERMGIEVIDIFVMSHPHSDHIGSFAQLAKRYEIRKVYKNYTNYTSGSYKRAMKEIAAHGIEVEVLSEGDSFKFGEFVDVQVFWPYDGQSVDFSDAGDTNRSCIAMKITYGDSSFWTSGDLYTSDEKTLVEKYGSLLDCDIMKINHHAYKTSSDRAFIDAISPKVAVAMHGKFANAVVPKRFLSAGAAVFHTYYDGSVKISTTGDGKYDIQSQYVRRAASPYGAPNRNGYYYL